MESDILICIIIVLLAIIENLYRKYEGKRNFVFTAPSNSDFSRRLSRYCELNHVLPGDVIEQSVNSTIREKAVQEAGDDEAAQRDLFLYHTYGRYSTPDERDPYHLNTSYKY